MAKQEFRLFVSSTFRDLQAERDELVKKVFPRIRKECHRRGVEFTEVDLRWGITPTEARTGKVVRICLEEIDRCAPYFIGILGSRYGWQPTHSDLDKDKLALKPWPWVRQLVDERRSIIEIEFAYGAMMRERNESAFFYQRTGSGRKLATTGDLSPMDEAHLSRLTRSLREKKLPIRRFETPEAFGEKVYRDLMRVIERDWPLNKTLSTLDIERAAHASFAKIRTRSYVADAKYERLFEKHIESDSAPLVITGRSGLGKSSLMAHLATRYAKLHPESFVIQHFIGASYTTDSSQIIRHIISEIKERYQLADEIPSDGHKLREDLPLWLAKVQGEKLVLVIDALDQLTGVSSELHWLPEFIPANVRLIVSITPTDALETLRKRGWKIAELKPLSKHARKQIVRGYLHQYHKALTSRQSEIIASKPQTASPLYLRTLLEELRVLGVFEELDAQIQLNLKAKDEHELFQQVLERLEADHGKSTVRAVMTAIWAARNGLSETELLAITGLPRWKLSSLLLSLDYHFMQRDGLNVFFHNYLREAVRLRYVRTTAAHRKAHALIGEYFSSQPFDDRRRDEEPWQWKHAHKLERLRETMFAPEMQALFTKESREYDVIPYYRELDMKKSLAEVVDSVMSSEDDLYERTLTVSRILTAASEHALNRKLLEHCLDHLYRGARKKRLKIEEELGIVLAQIGEYKESSRMMISVLAAKERMYGSDSSELCDALNCISHNWYQLQEYDTSIGYAVRSLELTPAEAINDRISRLQNLAAIENGKGNVSEAIRLCERALQLGRNLYGSVHPIIAQAEGNLGVFMMSDSRYEEALVHFMHNLEYYRSIFGESYIETWMTMNRLGVALIHVGRVTEALSYCINSQEVAQKLFGDAHVNTITAAITLAYLYGVIGEQQKAISLYKQWLPVKRTVLGYEHPSTLRSESQLAQLEQHAEGN